MFDKRLAGAMGIVAAILSWGGMFVFGALRPSYSHSVNAVSELGALGTPNALLWNIIGFIAPGLLLTVAGGAIALSIASGRRSPAFWLLIVSGLGFAGTGVSPAEVENGVAILTSPFTRGHFIASLVHGVAWLIAVLLLVRPMMKNPDWRRLALPSVALALATLLASTFLRGTFADAIVQRVAGGVYFAWILMMSSRLIALRSSRTQTAP